MSFKDCLVNVTTLSGEIFNIGPIIRSMFRHQISYMTFGKIGAASPGSPRRAERDSGSAMSAP